MFINFLILLGSACLIVVGFGSTFLGHHLDESHFRGAVLVWLGLIAVQGVE